MTAITHTYRFTGAGEDFGPRSFGMVTGHTWEGPYNALTVEDGLAMLAWQDADDVLGSYNRVCAVDGVISAVPDHRASGGINPASSFWAPKAWLREHFSAEEIANPNYFTLNVVALGRRSWFDTNGWPDEIIDGMARSWIDDERRVGRRLVWTSHSDFQSNRSDCGAICTALVKKRYAQLTGTAPQEDDMQFRNPIVTQEWDTVPGVASTFTRPDGTTGYFTAVERVKTVAEGTVDGVDSRLMDYGPDHEALVIARKGLTNPGVRIVGSPVPTVTTVVKEVIKEVPTGITQEQLDAAVTAAKSAGIAQEKNRVRVVLGV